MFSPPIFRPFAPYVSLEMFLEELRLLAPQPAAEFQIPGRSTCRQLLRVSRPRGYAVREVLVQLKYCKSRAAMPPLERSR